MAEKKESEDAEFDEHVQLEDQLLELGGDDPDRLRDIIWELSQKVGIEELKQVISLVEQED